MVASKSLPSFIASLLLLSNSATSLTLPTESANGKELLPRTETSSINMSDACRYQYGSGFSAQTIGNGCNDWVCVRGNERYGVDLGLWCEISVGDATCRTYPSCGNDVYSWRCNYEPC